MFHNYQKNTKAKRGSSLLDIHVRYGKTTYRETPNKSLTLGNLANLLIIYCRMYGHSLLTDFFLY